MARSASRWCCRRTTQTARWRRPCRDKTYLVAARIVGVATELDLALLKIDGMKLPALPLATYSQLRQGETVFAFGSPIGLRNSLTHGLVSAVARQVDPDSPLIYVQTDAPINPGIPAARWSTSAVKSSASTRSSCRSPEETRGWGSRFPAPRRERCSRN